MPPFNYDDFINNYEERLRSALGEEWSRTHEGRVPSYTDIGQGVWRILFEGKSLGSVWGEGGGVNPAPSPPTVPARHGMAHNLKGGTGRTLFGPLNQWYFTTTWPYRSEAQIREFFAHPDMEGMTHMWIALMAGHRSEMNERPFNPFDEPDLVKDKLDLMLDLGVQPMIELGSQEGLLHHFGHNDAKIRDYLEMAAQFFCHNRCKLVLVTREWGDRSFHGNLDEKERVKRFNSFNVAADKGLRGTDIALGVHTRSAEMPPVGLYKDVRAEKWWLAHFKFKWDVEDSFEKDGKHHRSAGEWFNWAIRNRQERIPGLKVAMFEHSIKQTGWGATQDVEEAYERGRHFMQSALGCLADFSGGYRR